MPAIRHGRRVWLEQGGKMSKDFLRACTVLVASNALLPFFATNAGAQTAGAAGAGAGASIEEVVVTATRRAEPLSKVPISVAAFTQQRLDQQGVRSIDDIAQLTPGVTFSRSDTRNAGAATIAIRGISSTAGSGTTGIYIDDTPIQVRNIGFSAYSAFPAVFDLQRVEVLRGPQGTLFGAGSEGGTVRFITPQPNLGEYSVYARGEAGFMDGGGPSYEAGAAVGGPIIDGKLGFRVSGWARRDGGYIDRVNYATGVAQERNSNYQDSRVLSGALKFAPTDALTLTASLYYQDIYNNDVNAYWLNLSDPGAGVFRQGNAIPSPSSDRFVLPSLHIDWDFGSFHLISNTSYFQRSQKAINDYTTFEASLWTGSYQYPTGMYAPTTQTNAQRNWTEELRLESTDPDARLNWVAGFFYSRDRQTATELVQDTFLPGIFQARTGVPFNVAFGQGLVNGLYTFVLDPALSHDEQIAGFGQLDYRLTDKLKATAGVRVARTQFDVYANFVGPVVGPPAVDHGSQKETPVTPKFGLSYQADDNNMFYFSAAKGYRIGGYNPKVGVPCGGQLASFGLADRPEQFQSDSVWSYEVGAKNALFNHRLQVNTSAYYIDWSNIQQLVSLNQCGFNFVANLGAARSEGFDLSAVFAATDHLTLSGALGYSYAEFTQTVKAGPLAAFNLVSKGDRIPGAPWTIDLSGQYDFTVAHRDGFVRFDYQHHAGGPNNVPVRNLTDAGSDPTIPALPSTDLMSIRAGVQFGGTEVSIFAKNLFDAHPELSRAYDPRTAPTTPYNYRGTTFMPRTIGVTVIARY